MTWILAALAGYGLGSVPAAALVARRHGVDLHRTADGNPGAWNALGQLGAARAWPAFVGDGGKALLAGLAGLALGGWWMGWTAVAAALAGHAVPLFARGRGGKGVMCLVGGLLALSPVATLACLVLCAAVTALRGFAWGARACVFALPFAQLVTDPIAHVAGTGALMTAIGALFALRHRRSAPASAGPAAAPRS